MYSKMGDDAIVKWLNIDASIIIYIDPLFKCWYFKAKVLFFFD